MLSFKNIVPHLAGLTVARVLTYPVKERKGRRPRAPKVNLNRELVCKALTNGWKSTPAITEETGLSYKHAHQALRELALKGEVEKRHGRDERNSLVAYWRKKI